MKTAQNRLYYFDDPAPGESQGYVDYETALDTAKRFGLGAEAIRSTESSRVSASEDEELLDEICESLKEAGSKSKN